MGVSYAAPAYYADRLCERGRCYLRALLSPSQSERDELDKQRHAEEKKFGLFPPKKFDREAEREKTWQQRDREGQALRAKKERVQDALRKHVFDKAVKKWEAVDEKKDFNQDKTTGLGKTMYWM
jgi:eukaryotic translation initiation factor 2C